MPHPPKPPRPVPPLGPPSHLYPQLPRPLPPPGPPPRPYPGMLRPQDSLLRAIERSFGSLEDFRRVLHSLSNDGRRGGWIYLVCTPGGELRLVRTPRHVVPRGTVLFRFPAHGAPDRNDWEEAADRYKMHLAGKPPFPVF